MTATLAWNRVSPATVQRLSHPLAALNHQDWTYWERWVLRDPQLLATASVDDIIQAALADGLENVIQSNAGIITRVVERTIGLAFPVQASLIVQRKLEQFRSWVAYAIEQPPDMRTRWLLQCRTPFLLLPPKMQRSDYAEAMTDFIAVAEAGGLVLPDPMPSLEPLSLSDLRWELIRHRFGLHDLYVTSEAPWSNVCAGCRRSWGGHY
jgi:hypothetical protein